jgi:uncharacterized membrane protein
MADLLTILMRWTHITSITFLAGTAVFSALAVYPALQAMPEADQQKTSDRLAGLLRPWVVIAVILAFGSGMYNLLHKVDPPKGYHMWFGIKFLLALHIAAIALIMGRPGVALAKRRRQVAGSTVTALLVIALSAYLRFMK